MPTQSPTPRPLHAFIRYGVVSILMLTACSLFPFITHDYRHLLYYLAIVIALIAGSLHIRYLNQIFNIGSRGNFAACLLFTLAPVVTSIILSGIIYYILKLPFDFLSFQTAFIVPFPVYQSYAYFTEIPAEKYKHWSYPLFDQTPKTEDMDRSVTELVNLVLSKQPDSPTQTSFKLDAPLHIPVGSLFFSFINEYNKTHPENPIIYADNKAARYGWIFYRKKGLLMQKECIDPEISFLNNGIRKNDIIYAARADEETEESANYLQTEDLTRKSVSY